MVTELFATKEKRREDAFLMLVESSLIVFPDPESIKLTPYSVTTISLRRYCSPSERQETPISWMTAPRELILQDGDNPDITLLSDICMRWDLG